MSKQESQAGCPLVQRPHSQPLSHTASMLIGPSALPTTIELSLFTVQFSLLQTTDFLPFFSLSANDPASYLQRKQKPSDHCSCSLATRCVHLPASLVRAALGYKAIVSSQKKAQPSDNRHILAKGRMKPFYLGECSNKAIYNL